MNAREITCSTAFLLLLLAITGSYGQVVIYNPGNPGGSGGVPSANDQLQEIARRRGEQLRRQREEAQRQAELAERAALDHEKNYANTAAVSGGKLAEKMGSLSPEASAYPQAKFAVEEAQKHLKNVADAKALCDVAQNSAQARVQTDVIKRELPLAFTNATKANNIVDFGRNRTLFIDKAYTATKDKLKFAQSSLDKLTQLKKELRAKTSDVTSDWMLVKASAALSLQQTMGVVKEALGAYITMTGDKKAMAAATAIDVSEAFAKALVEETIGKGTTITAEAFGPAMEAAAYKALISAHPALIIPDKVISTTLDLRSWDEVAKNHSSLRRYVSEQMRMMDRSIAQYQKIIDSSTATAKGNMNKGAVQYLNSKAK
jgi:hypothetical protein